MSYSSKITTSLSGLTTLKNNTSLYFLIFELLMEIERFIIL